LDQQEEIKLIDEAKADPKRFEPLYNAYFQPIFLFIFKRVADQEIAADITSQVFLNALTHLKKFKHTGAPFSAWLYRIAFNEVQYHYRKTARQRHVVINEDIIENFQDETGLQLEDLYQKLTLAIQTLKLEAIQLIELRFFEKRSFKEIGIILEVTENNAKVRTYRVLDQLKKVIDNG
jgi:RNA polymerase sigma-70 factor (ECF subfamily)